MHRTAAEGAGTTTRTQVAQDGRRPGRLRRPAPGQEVATWRVVRRHGRRRTTAGTGTTSTSSSTATTSTGEIPDETAGPYPGDGSDGPDVLETSGIVRSDLTSGFGDASGTADGVPMDLFLTLTDIAGGGVLLAGAAVYVRHCDAQGRQSLCSDGVTEEDYLRGVQVADADGCPARSPPGTPSPRPSRRAAAGQGGPRRRPVAPSG